MLVDGTYIPTGNRPSSGQDRANYSAYRGCQCVSIQIAATLDGTLRAVSKTVPGSRHDGKAIDLTGWASILPNGQWIAHSAYIGKGAITPIKRHSKRDLLDWERDYNHAIAHLKHWRTISTGYRGPLDLLPQIIRTISKLELYRLCQTT